MKNLNDGTKFMIGVGILFTIMILLQSCASPEIYFAREQARETAYLKRIAADTLARPVQNHYTNGTILNGWVPRYNNGYWYNGVFYNNPYYRPIIRFNSNRYVVPYRKSKKYRKYGNSNSSNRYRSTRRVPTQKRIKQRTNGKPNRVHRSRSYNNRNSTRSRTSNKRN